MRSTRAVTALTLANAVVFVANAVVGRSYFFTLDARPGGAHPAWHDWFGVMWWAGPLLSVAALAWSAVVRGKARATWVNVAVTVAYVLLWLFYLHM